MITIESTHYFTEYKTDKYKVLMPVSNFAVNFKYTFIRLFHASGIYIGAYSILDAPDFLLKLYDPENVSSGEDVDHIIDRFLKLKAFL